MWFNVLLLISIFFSISANASFRSLGNEGRWKITFNSQEYPVEVGARLTNQIGHLRATDVVEYNSVFIISRTEEKYNGLLIPYLGGKVEVFLNRSKIYASNKVDHEGLVIPFSPLEGKNDLKISVDCDAPMYCGIWRDIPIIGDLPTVIELRETKLQRDRYLPLFTGSFLVCASLFFFACYFALRKKYKSYLIFAFTLLTWGLFYISFAGTVRSMSPFFSNIIHFPLRTTAAAFLALLISTYADSYEKCKKIALPTLLTMLTIQVYFGFTSNAFGNILITIVASTLSLAVLFTFKWRELNFLKRFVFMSSLVAAVGQAHDALILMNGYGIISMHAKFVNQFTFPPLILTSFAVHISEFLNQFISLRGTLIKVRKLARTSICLASECWELSAWNELLKGICSATKVERASISALDTDGIYKLIAGFGIDPQYHGAEINTTRNKFARQAIETGNVVFGNLDRNEIWKSERFVAIPIPKMAKPKFILFLSDSKDLEVFEKSQSAFLSQISSMVWNYYKRNDEELKRHAVEKKFGSLVQRLDPNLYEFIINNLNRLDDPDKMVSDTRGIVFFDQKAYSTMTENFDDATMSRLARIVGEWVTTSAARYGARISNFAGDAFLLETFSIGTESEESIALRTLNLVWALANNMGELNQILLRDGFSPVTFRFGAHIGKVAAANLDFIQKGLSNSIGDTVNIAARLQNLAKAGAIYISGELARYTDQKFEVTEVPKQYVKGRSNKIQIFSLVGKLDEQTILDQTEAS